LSECGRIKSSALNELSNFMPLAWGRMRRTLPFFENGTLKHCAKHIEVRQLRRQLRLRTQNRVNLLRKLHHHHRRSVEVRRSSCALIRTSCAWNVARPSLTTHVPPIVTKPSKCTSFCAMPAIKVSTTAASASSGTHDRPTDGTVQRAWFQVLRSKCNAPASKSPST
jgi:hypothetical protein